MTNRITGLSGILTTIFIVGFVGLFIMNPQTYDELNNLSIASYYLPNMNGNLWIQITGYLLPGLLTIVISILLFINYKNNSVIVVGKILLLLSGLIWLSFGLTKYDPNAELEIHLMLIRIMIVLATMFLGLILLGAEIEKIKEDKFLKIWTIGCGSLILLLCAISVFIANDETYIRTNFSFLIFFIWIGIFGIRILRKPAPNNGEQA